MVGGVLCVCLMFGCGGCVRFVLCGCLWLVGCGVLRCVFVVCMMWVDVCVG